MLCSSFRCRTSHCLETPFASAFRRVIFPSASLSWSRWLFGASNSGVPFLVVRLCGDRLVKTPDARAMFDTHATGALPGPCNQRKTLPSTLARLRSRSCSLQPSVPSAVISLRLMTHARHKTIIPLADSSSVPPPPLASPPEAQNANPSPLCTLLLLVRYGMIR